MGAFMGDGTYYNGSGYGSVAYSGYGTCSPWFTASSWAIPTTTTSSTFCQPRELTKEERREIIKQRAKELLDERKRKRAEKIRLSKRTLAELSEESKVRFMKIVNDTYKEYRRAEEVKQIMSGVKWFFILLGVAVLLNFPRILSIIEIAFK